MDILVFSCHPKNVNPFSLQNWLKSYWDLTVSLLWKDHGLHRDGESHRTRVRNWYQYISIVSVFRDQSEAGIAQHLHERFKNKQNYVRKMFDLPCCGCKCALCPEWQYTSFVSWQCSPYFILFLLCFFHATFLQTKASNVLVSLNNFLKTSESEEQKALTEHQSHSKNAHVFGVARNALSKITGMSSNAESIVFG